MTRYTVYHYRRYVALDERAYIVDEFVGHVGTVLGYPLTRNELFVICNLVNIFYFCAALVRIVGQTLKDNHFAGIPLIRSLDGSTAYLISFQDIHAGCTMGSRALKRTQLNCTGLAADLACNITCKIICRSGELFVSESVYEIDTLAQLAYITSVSKADSSEIATTTEDFLERSSFTLFPNASMSNGSSGR